MDLKWTIIRIILMMLSLPQRMVDAVDPNLARPLNFAYGNTGGPQITTYTPAQMLGNISLIQPNVSAIIPFLLNVNNTHLDNVNYTAFINNFAKWNIKVYPAIGDGVTPINSTAYLNISKGYRTFTDCIQITDVQPYVNGSAGTLAQLEWMIHYLNVTLKFQHIQMNPWPVHSDQTAISFNNPAVDSAMEQVELDFSRTTYQVTPDPSNWTPNPNKIAQILHVNPTAQIVINYENQPEELALDTLKTSVQISAFQRTIANITQSYPDANVHWMPPWSNNYDPIANGTWGFIVNQLNKGNP